MSSGVKRKASQTHCFAPGCSSGYVSARKSGRQVSLFSVPKDPERFKAWQRAVPRADKPLEATSVLCELHFDEQYLVRFFTHTINGETVRIPRDRPKLTDNAIPTVYPNVPAYLSKKPPQKRTSRTSTGGLPAKIPRCEGSASVHDNAADSHEDGSFSNSPTALDIASCEPPSAYWAKHRIAEADSATAFISIQHSSITLAAMWQGKASQPQSAPTAVHSSCDRTMGHCQPQHASPMQ